MEKRGSRRRREVPVEVSGEVGTRARRPDVRKDGFWEDVTGVEVFTQERDRSFRKH